MSWIGSAVKLIESVNSAVVNELVANRASRHDCRSSTSGTREAIRTVQLDLLSLVQGDDAESSTGIEPFGGSWLDEEGLWLGWKVANDLRELGLENY